TAARSSSCFFPTARSTRPRRSSNGCAPRPRAGRPARPASPAGTSPRWSSTWSGAPTAPSTGPRLRAETGWSRHRESSHDGAMGHELTVRFRKARRDPALTVVEGFHALKHALRFGAEVEEAVAVDPQALEALTLELAPDLAGRLSGRV